MVRDLCKEQGVTVFLCTHQLKYAEDICTLYGFINEGKLLGFGSFVELLRKKGGKTYLDIRGKNINELKGAKRLDENKLRVEIENDEDASRILSGILSSGGKLYEAKQTQWSLEDLYFSYQK